MPGGCDILRCLLRVKAVLHTVGTRLKVGAPQARMTVSQLRLARQGAHRSDTFLGMEMVGR